MFTLRTELDKEDYEFFSVYIKILLQDREGKNKNSLKANEKSLQEKTYEKFIIPLAEKGQVESIQMYCENFPPFTQMDNNRIVDRIKKLEAKSVKTPREYLALSAYYNWFTRYYEYTYKIVDENKSTDYARAKENYKAYYNKAFQDLYQLGKTDPLANEQAFLLRKKNKELLTKEEYLRVMSNYRNQFDSTANHQINQDMRLKFMIGYSLNLIKYASDNEFTNKQPQLTTVIASLQKEMIRLEELRR